MERHRCKLCYRKFANGRALGGHMRSHLMNLPIIPPPKPSYENESRAKLSPSSSSSSSSSYSSDEEVEEEEEVGEEIEKGLGYKLRENPKKNLKFADVEFSNFGSSSISVTLEERDNRKDLERECESESESESSKNVNPTKKRSKRRGIKRIRNVNSPSIETTSSISPASSVSDVTSEEDVALCLMMLSRDNWTAATAGGDGSGKEKFKCHTCNKAFRSYQALGGHRASHKKIRPENHQQAPQTESKPEPGPGPGSEPMKQSKTHECPVCFRVFASAQALGGHKRTHSGSSSGGGAHGGASNPKGVEDQSPMKKMNAFIDLNLPAPVDHDDEISEVSLCYI